MKNLSQFSLVFLFCLFACETPAEDDSQLNETTYDYITDQQFDVLETFLIDFENYNSGDIVSEIFITNPFENALVEGITMSFPNTNTAMIFDSSNPTGGDFDLGTPNVIYGGPGIGNGGASNDTALGNVLILSEDLDATDPDDIFEIGASFVFDFSNNTAVTLNSFDILDIEESSNPTIVNLYDLQENLLLSKNVMAGGDNSKTNVDLENTSDVAFMEIIMNSSGAIDNISLELETQQPCVNCDSNIVELTFKYVGSLQDATIRVETLNGHILLDSTVQLNETFTILGNLLDGTFESDIIIFINDQEVTTLATDCSQVIGPGYIINSLEIVSGITQTGGQLCPVQIAF